MPESREEARVRAFLIADIRGYTRFTHEHGDEAAAELVKAFTAMTKRIVDEHQGRLVEMRGDEALAVFVSTRLALKAALGLQECYRQPGNSPDVIPVGIGIDVGEAVEVEGGFRGAALNVAARLCSLAGPPQILVTHAVGHLAGKMEGVTLVDQGRRPVKGLAEPIAVFEVLSGDATPSALPPADVDQGRSVGGAFLDRLEPALSSFGERIQSLVQDSLEGGLHALEEDRAPHRPLIPPGLGAAHPLLQKRGSPRGTSRVLVAAGVTGIVLLLILVATLLVVLHPFS